MHISLAECLVSRYKALIGPLQAMLLPRDPDDERNVVILDIRAGTGGDEAALWAGELFTTYHRYAAEMGWKCTVLEESIADTGGLKMIMAELSGENVYSHLK